MKQNFPSVAFAIPSLSPESCGITDYAIRMAALLGSLGVKTGVLYGTGSHIDEDITTTDGMVVTGILNCENSLKYDVLAVQYVPSFKDQKKNFYNAVTIIRHPGLHLMIHECWRFNLGNYRLSLRGYLASYRQKRLLKSLHKQWKPISTATTNQYYQNLLSKSGIEAFVSPMPGGIPVVHGGGIPADLELPEWWNTRKKKFLFVSFGNLYLEFWNCSEHFKEASEVAKLSNNNFAWVICGRQSAGAILSIQEAARNYGFSESIFFAGALPPASVDWWLREADACLSGNPGELWPKSSGTLAAVERQLPVLLPRGWESGKLENGGVFLRNIRELLEFRKYGGVKLAGQNLRDGRVTAQHFVDNVLHSV